MKTSLVKLDCTKKYTAYYRNKIAVVIFCSFLFVAATVQNSIAQSYSINTSAALPDSSAMLDIVSSSKGLLIPRVSLTSSVDSSTIAHPAVSLLVYNTNSSMTGGGKGFFYWDGSKWIRQVGGTGTDSLTVSGALVSPHFIGGHTAYDSIVYQTTTGNGTTGADHVFRVGNNGGTEAMRILNSGNVGIGTTTPGTAKLYVNSTTAPSSNDYGSVFLNAIISPTTNLSTIIANATLSQVNGNINITGTAGLVGLNVDTRTNLVSPGTVTNMMANRAQLNNLNTGTVTNMIGYNVPVANNLGGGTVTNLFGFKVAPQTIGSTICAAYAGEIAAASNRYNLYMNGTAQNYLAGNVGIGTSSPSAKLHSLGTTEQLRLGYDASNYYSTTVGSSGAVTFDATGSGAAFTFSDAVSLASGSTASTQALNDSTTKVATTAFVDRAIAGVSGGSGWGLTGNSGTTDGTNFIGTTDNVALNFKVNNQKAGRIDNYAESAFLGYQSGNSISSGYYLTALGNKALYSNTSGASNTAIGHNALYHSTTGSYNTALGDVALYTSTTGDYNTAVGQQALYYNSTGNSNTGVGMQALAVNTSGGYNAAVGYAALGYNTTGTFNTAVGFGAAATNTTGYYNTFLGYATDVNANNLSNSTAIGYAAIATGSNYVKIGNSSVATIAGQVSWTTLSDNRFKTNVNDTDIKGLDFIMRLRPVSYNVDTRKYEEFLTKNMPDSVRLKRLREQDFTKSTAKRHNGFIAQEVETAAQASGYEFSGLHKPETEDDNYGLAYSDFVVPLIKAVQEQQQLIKDQQQTINQLTQRITQLEARKQQ